MTLRHLARSFAFALCATCACSSAKPAENTAAKSAASPAASEPSPLEGAALVLDVRTPEEHESGHLEGDMLVPIDQLEGQLGAIEAAVGGDKSKKIVTYCKSGNRAGRAKALLEAHGFTNVVNGGGYASLKP